MAKAGISARRLERAFQDRCRHRALAIARISCSRCCWLLIVSWAFVRSTPFAVDRLSASCSSSRPRSIRSAMAATTRRRPWASSRCCFIRRASRQRILRAVLGGAGLPGGDGARHPVGRLAYRANHGLENHPADADAGVLRGDRRRGDLVYRDMARRSRSRPLIRSPGRSSASARRGGSRRCAGTWRVRLSTPGLSPSRPRPGWRRWHIGQCCCCHSRSPLIGVSWPQFLYGTGPVILDPAPFPCHTLSPCPISPSQPNSRPAHRSRPKSRGGGRSLSSPIRTLAKPR